MKNRRLGFIVRDQVPLLMRPTETVQSACEAMRERHVGLSLTNMSGCSESSPAATG